MLRGENNLAHGSSESPPSASLDKTAHTLALSRVVGLEYRKLADEEWRELIERSGEDALWSAYYLCLAGAAGPQTTAEQFRNSTGFELPKDLVRRALSSETLTADAGLEFLSADSVNSCLNLGVPRPRRVVLGEDQALVVKARLQRWAQAEGVAFSITVEPSQVRDAIQLAAAQGCSDWNQTLSYAILVLEPEHDDPAIASCAADRSVAGVDPVALSTSVELGMPIGLAGELARSADFARYLETSWRPASHGQVPTGLGTVQNSVALVNLLRITGIAVPAWLKAGADEQVASSEGSGDLDPHLALLCVMVEANCGAAAKQWVHTQRDPVSRVMDGGLDDMAGAAIVQTLIEAGERPDLLHCPVERVAELFQKAPQTLVQLATIDKVCWEAVTSSSGKLSSRIGAAIHSGAFEDAEALMLFANLNWTPDEIEPLKESAQADLELLIADINRERGARFLTDTKPLRFVLLQATIEKW